MDRCTISDKLRQSPETGHPPGETYLPDVLAGARYHEPFDQGLERSIAERLERLREEGKEKQ